MPSGKGPELFLLDTHVWIWLVNGERRIQTGFLGRRLKEKGPELHFHVSVMSVLEAGMLEAKGRIEFAWGCSEWVRRALRSPEITLAPLTSEIAVASSRLPGDFHGDPVDRILAATAQSLGAAFITQDSRILTYSKHHPLRAIPAF